jgi:hypothetical protein
MQETRPVSAVAASMRNAVDWTRAQIVGEGSETS